MFFFKLTPSIEEGARIPVRLAAEDIGGISGKFWKNSSLTEKGYGQATDWRDEDSWSLEDIKFLTEYVV